MDSSSVVRLMSRRNRTQAPTFSRLLKPVVHHNVQEKLLTHKEHQASIYNMGTKDLLELKNGNSIRLIPPQSWLTRPSKRGWTNQWELGLTKWLLKMVSDIDGTVVTWGKEGNLTAEAHWHIIQTWQNATTNRAQCVLARKQILKVRTIRNR